MNNRRLLARLLSGRLQNVSLADAEALMHGLGFRLLRSNGSHRIYGHPAADELLILQARHGEAKPYQLRQLLDLVEHYNLSLEDE